MFDQFQRQTTKQEKREREKKENCFVGIKFEVEERERMFLRK